MQIFDFLIFFNLNNNQDFFKLTLLVLTSSDRTRKTRKRKRGKNYSRDKCLKTKQKTD